jgi:imidazolonepropionase-like amidohydrolase
MRRPLNAAACLIACAASAPASAQAPPPAPPSPAPILAIENVTILPMDSERVLRDHTVMVEGRRIVTVEPSAAVTVPAGAARVDGRGKFLMPGLAEMHAHFPSPQGLAQYGEGFGDRLLFLNVACGVTTVRGMIGGPRDLQIREEVARGLRLGPQIFTAGPSINGNSVPDVGAARRVVTEQRAAGYDLLKVHPGVKRDAFDEVARTARAEGIPFAGHVPADVGLVRALLSGMRTVEHLDGYLEALQEPGAEPPAQTGFFGSSIVDTVDEAQIAPLAAATRAAGVWNTPTQILVDNLFGGATVDEVASRPEMKYLPAAMLRQWREGAQQLRGPDFDPARARRFVETRRRLIRALRDAGAGLVLGADAPQVFNVPGFATLRELEALVHAGLTPFQALQAGTRNPAIVLGLPDSFGTVEVGRRADLLLLDADPLADIRNVWKRAGVVAAGRWLPASELDARLAEYAAARDQAREVAQAEGGQVRPRLLGERDRMGVRQQDPAEHAAGHDARGEGQVPRALLPPVVEGVGRCCRAPAPRTRVNRPPPPAGTRRDGLECPLPTEDP